MCACPFVQSPHWEREPGPRGEARRKAGASRGRLESLGGEGGTQEEGAGVGEARGWLSPCTSPVQLLPLPWPGLPKLPQRLRHCPRGPSAPVPALAGEQGSLVAGEAGGAAL